MESNTYVRKEQQDLSFPYDWRQTFHHPFEMARVYNEAQTVKTFVSATDERQCGLEILILLLDYTFATEEQIKRLLAAKGIEIEGNLSELLEDYLDRRLINKFTLSAYEMDHIPEDAFVIYCLDHASRHVLSHFYRDDVAVTWRSTNAFRSAELVSKYLATNEFYLSLLTTKGEDLESFQPTVNFTIKNREIRLSATFRIMKGENPRDFILEVIRNSDIPVAWRKKVNEQLSPFILDRFWGRYFRMEPVLIFLAEDIKQAEEISEIYFLRTESLKFRVTTDGELLKGIHNATFYKYDPEGSPRMVPVIASIFKQTRS